MPRNFDGAEQAPKENVRPYTARQAKHRAQFGRGALKWKSRDWIADITRLRTSGEARSLTDICFQLDVTARTLRSWMRRHPSFKAACHGFAVRSPTWDIVAFRAATIDRYHEHLAAELGNGTPDLQAKWNAADKAITEQREARAEHRRKNPRKARYRMAWGTRWRRREWPKIVAQRQFLEWQKWTSVEIVCLAFGVTAAVAIDERFSKDAMVYYFAARNHLARLQVKKAKGEAVQHLIDRFFGDWASMADVVGTHPLDLAKLPGHEGEVAEVKSLSHKVARVAGKSEPARGVRSRKVNVVQQTPSKVGSWQIEVAVE